MRLLVLVGDHVMSHGHWLLLAVVGSEWVGRCMLRLEPLVVIEPHGVALERELPMDCNPMGTRIDSQFDRGLET